MLDSSGARIHCLTVRLNIVESQSALTSLKCDFYNASSAYKFLTEFLLDV